MGPFSVFKISSVWRITFFQADVERLALESQHGGGSALVPLGLFHGNLDQVGFGLPQGGNMSKDFFQQVLARIFPRLAG